jgi:transposase
MSTLAQDILAEQSGEGPGNGGIAKSVNLTLSFGIEQSGEGPGNGGKTRSVTGGKGVKRKKESKSMEEKYAAIIECEKGLRSKTEIAKQFSVPLSTLSTWLKNKDSIKDGYQKFGPKRKSMKVGLYDELEEVLTTWFKATRSNNIPISGPMLQAKADELAHKMSVQGFNASNGWLDRFKERHGITFKKVCGESNSVNSSSDDMTAWQSRLKLILEQYDSCDIFNADETGIFYQLTPDKTLDFKNVQCHGGKKSKARLTALVCANMAGTEKLPLLVYINISY